MIILLALKLELIAWPIGLKMSIRELVKAIKHQRESLELVILLNQYCLLIIFLRLLIGEVQEK
jgi:hypothetical protein